MSRVTGQKARDVWFPSWFTCISFTLKPSKCNNQILLKDVNTILKSTKNCKQKLKRTTMSFFFSSIKTDVFPNKAPISQNLRISSYSKPPDNIDAIGRKYRRSLSNPPSKTHKEKRSRITYHALLEAGLQIRQDPDLLSADKRSPASWKPRKREEINNQKGSRSQSSTLLLLDAAADR